MAALDEAASRLVMHGGRLFERCGEPCREIRGGDAVPQIRRQEDVVLAVEDYYRADRLADRVAATGGTATVRGLIEVFMPELLELSMEEPHARRSLEGTALLWAATPLEQMARDPGTVDAYMRLQAAREGDAAQDPAPAPRP